jgi:inosine-uridine nucleoside N-ribohydrolase
VLVADTVKAWRRGGEKLWGNRPNVILHDPLAVYSAIDESFITTEDVLVDVVDKGPFKGFTVNLNAYSKSHLNNEFCKEDFNTVTVAKTVDSAGFIDKFFSILLNK